MSNNVREKKRIMTTAKNCKIEQFSDHTSSIQIICDKGIIMRPDKKKDRNAHT